VVKLLGYRFFIGRADRGGYKECGNAFTFAYKSREPPVRNSISRGPSTEVLMSS